ncbi:MAG: tRNA (guanosine(46)-N7)-methyltransferase TrmB [Parachlamydiales bacterium]|nr:tRNA (guanosine(46)-N7)-methyltransferase TrmB [Parachlamydiales bacterium]
MEIKKLILPFDYENRKPILLDRLLYIPKFYDKHESFDQKIKMFDENFPVNIEYCSGNGQWIIEKAKSNPNINWIAVEMKRIRVEKIFKKMQMYNLKNLFIVFGKAEDFTNYYLSENCVDQVFINFPDPWPKKKHAKNRIIKPDFIDSLRRILKDSSIVTLVTDDDNYKDQMIEKFLNNVNFDSVYEKPYYSTDIEDFGSSFFDDFWRRKNKIIKYLKFKKINRGRGI